MPASSFKPLSLTTPPSTHAAAVDQTVGLAGRWRQIGLFEQGTNTQRRAGQRHIRNIVGHAALAAVDEVLLGRIGRRSAVEAGRDFLGKRHLRILGLRPAATSALSAAISSRLLKDNKVYQSHIRVSEIDSTFKTWCWRLR